MHAATIPAIGLQWPTIPNQANESPNLLLNAMGSLLTAICLALLARGIRATRALRWLILAAFSYDIFGVNNQIEAAVFTRFGGTGTMILFLIAPCLLASAVAAWLIGLVSTTLFPPTLRIAHSLEILADSVVYAWLLVAVLIPRARAEAPETSRADAR